MSSAHHALYSTCGGTPERLPTPWPPTSPRQVGQLLLLLLKLQALVYDILPPTTAITDYAVGLGKLSANGQLFVSYQMAVSLSQTAKIISGFFYNGHCPDITVLVDWA